MRIVKGKTQYPFIKKPTEKGITRPEKLIFSLKPIHDTSNRSVRSDIFYQIDGISSRFGFVVGKGLIRAKPPD